jgi:succinate dehydrogenase / fumarate reductase flavoprotein subunit
VGLRFEEPSGGPAVSAFDVVARLRSLMTASAGILRDAEGLARGAAGIAALAAELPRLTVRDTSRVHNAELVRSFEAENMVALAEAVIASAIDRTESRGAHTRRDHPKRDDETWLRHILVRPDGGRVATSYRPVRIDRDKHPPAARSY